MKILNAYSGIGGNRKLWGDEHEITAVELDPDIAKIYQDYFPGDKMIIGDAHLYLLDHFNEYDFIWTSRPCPSHSRARYWGWHNERPIYPDFAIYEEIVFLKHHFNGQWTAENVVPYYDPLIPGKKIGRHLFWANFNIGNYDHKSSDIRKLSGTSKKDKMLRNMVDPDIGLYILNCAQNIITKQNIHQGELFI